MDKDQIVHAEQESLRKHFWYCDSPKSQRIASRVLREQTVSQQLVMIPAFPFSEATWGGVGEKIHL